MTSNPSSRWFSPWVCVIYHCARVVLSKSCRTKLAEHRLYNSMLPAFRLHASHPGLIVASLSYRVLCSPTSKGSHRHDCGARLQCPVYTDVFQYPPSQLASCPVEMQIVEYDSQIHQHVQASVDKVRNLV